MRFKMIACDKDEQGYLPNVCLPFLPAAEFEVVTLDEHEAIVAALEAEIEAATCLICHRCDLADEFSPAVRNGRTGKWVHGQFGDGSGPIECFAERIHESHYQHQQEHPCPKRFDDLASALPATFYADRPLAERLRLMVEHWRQGIDARAEMEQENAELKQQLGEQVLLDKISVDIAHANLAERFLALRHAVEPFVKVARTMLAESAFVAVEGWTHRGFVVGNKMDVNHWRELIRVFDGKE